MSEHLEHRPTNGSDWVSKSPVRARNLPHRTNEAKLQSTLKKLAKKILLELEPDAHLDERTEEIHAIQTALLFHLRETMETVSERKIFYLGNDVWVSTRELQEKFFSIRERLKNGKNRRTFDGEEDAVLQGLYELGAITIDELRRQPRKKKTRTREGILREIDTTSLNAEILDSLRWSRGFVNDQLKHLQELISRYQREDKIPRLVVSPEIHPSLSEVGVYGLLKCLFETGHSERERNDAQILLNVFLLHWNLKRYIEKVHSAHSKSDAEGKISRLFRESSSAGIEPALSLDKEKGEFKAKLNEDGEVAGQLRRLHTIQVGRNTYSCHLTLSNDKGIPAGVVKSFKKDRKGRPEDIPDLYRTRAVLWGVTTKQIQQSPTIQSDIENILLRVGINALGLNHRRDLYNQENCSEQLDNGDFCIDFDLKGRYPKICINAKLKNGQPFEFQLLPFDVHCAEQVKETGIDHDSYEEVRNLELAKSLIPYDVSPVSHQVADLRLAELNQLKEGTMEAMKSDNFQEFFANNNFFYKQEAA